MGKLHSDKKCINLPTLPLYSMRWNMLIGRATGLWGGSL